MLQNFIETDGLSAERAQQELPAYTFLMREIADQLLEEPLTSFSLSGLPNMPKCKTLGDMVKNHVVVLGLESHNAKLKMQWLSDTLSLAVAVDGNTFIPLLPATTIEIDTTMRLIAAIEAFDLVRVDQITITSE